MTLNGLPRFGSAELKLILFWPDLSWEQGTWAKTAAEDHDRAAMWRGIQQGSTKEKENELRMFGPFPLEIRVLRHDRMALGAFSQWRRC